MSSKTFWRNSFFVLAVFNLLFWLWSDGSLRFVGLGPKLIQEPQRLENQVDPELLTIKQSASEASSR